MSQRACLTAAVGRLRNTVLLNGEEIHDRLDLRPDASSAGQTGVRPSGGRAGLATRNPYEPAYRESFSSPAELAYPLPRNAQSYRLDEREGTFVFHGQEPVLRWYSSLSSDTEVCGVRFVDAERVRYRLRTFADRRSALVAGYIVTHSHHCGTCSSLRDLAVYLQQPDRTTPARSCARKWTAGAVRMCLMEEIGFDAHCAETWTCNVPHTRGRCAASSAVRDPRVSRRACGSARPCRSPCRWFPAAATRYRTRSAHRRR